MLTLHSQILSTPLFLLLCVFGWMCHHATSTNVLFFLIILWFDMDDMIFTSTLIWCHAQRQQPHTGRRGTNKLTHAYKYIFCITCAHNIYNLLKQTFFLQRSTISFPKITYLYVVELIYLLIRFNKTKSFLWNAKNTDRNDTSEQKKHTSHIDKGKLRKG